MTRRRTLHTLRGFLASALVLGAFAGSSSALAETTITVDGAITDWASVTTCFTEAAGDSNNGIDLTRTCLENNNNAGSNGYMFALYVAANNFPNGDKYVGFGFDKNDDGVLDDTDDVFAFFFQGNNTQASALQVLSAGTYQSRPGRTYTTTTSCGATTGQDGWLTRLNGRNVEVRVGYGCLGLAYGGDDRMFVSGVYPNFDVTPSAFYNGSTVPNGMGPPSTPPDVMNFTATAQSNKVVLSWTNPTQHEGVVIFRQALSSPNQAPVNGVEYMADGGYATDGGVTVVYADKAPNALGGSDAGTVLDDDGLQNGTRYYYRIFNHHQTRTYSPGIVPTATGLFAEPTTGAAGAPVWCYSTGAAALMQPVTQAGTGIFFADNNGAVTALQTQATGHAQDGTERYRPVQLTAGVEGRFPVVPLQGQTGNFILTGDKSGRAYAIRADTGQILWRANGGAVLGDRILAQPAAQLRAFANAAFQSAFTYDLVFFATRNNSTTSNKVYAIRSDTGAIRWTYQPNDLDIISGGMFVDYTNNRLWVTARGTNSVRVINTLTGAEIGRLALGASDFGPNLDSGSQTVLLVTNAGMVYGYPVNATFPNPTPRFTYNLGGAPSAYVYPTGGGFIASRSGAAGWVRYFKFNGGTVTPVWNAVSIPNPSVVTVHIASQKIYAGSSDGRLREIDVTTGATKLLTIATGQSLGPPSIDKNANRLHVGTLDGRVCAVAVPFP